MKLKLTYREAYDRIVTAYFKDELKPFDNCACFIGNLLDGNDNWQHARLNQDGSELRFISFESVLCGIKVIQPFGYSRLQITEMEANFLRTLREETIGIEEGEGVDRIYTKGEIAESGELYESALFNAMSSTLDMLKKIHEDSGEVIDAPIFKKRSLQKA